ncbi:lysine--tRNA ligase [Candidatus Gottesmanbacteria bacterium]|nr:lysine--tRNA ligase [Candidatus Gottesmanbacteria bacterium]
MATIDELKKVRLEKLEALKKLGIDPYPSLVRRDHTIAQAVTMEDKEAAVAGRIMGLRGHGKIMFGDLRDESGKIQVVFKSDEIALKTFELLEFIDIGDFIAVQGDVGKTQAGEISVFVKDFQVITKSLRPLPDQWYGLKDVEERYRKRYLDMLLNPEVTRRFMIRSRVVDAIRDFLTDRRFLEVETPTLQPVYGGGLAKPFVTHHNELETDLYLRISDEMYLKRLIVGGLEKVFEITKVFRNEGVDRDHNPEFTMFEAQIAFQDYAYGMDSIEEIIEYVAQKVLGTTKFDYQGVGMDFKRPWPRYRMVEAISRFAGIDPLTWKSIEEAKEAIQKLEQISEDKLGDLRKIHSIGECIAFVFEEVVEAKLIQPSIVYDYPIENSPLAKKCDDPRFTQRFEMFAFGSELGNNYTELNDPVDLKKRFIEEKKREKAGVVEAHQTDNEYLEAIEHGFPPTCGIAIGVDRLVMLLTNAKSIKEVIPFPTLRPEK